MSADVVVIGAGLVGSAIAYGLAGRGAKVLVLDGEDRDFRAANANGGLVWLHGKGIGLPAYYELSRTSVELFRGLSDELADSTGFDLQLEQNGGLWLFLSDEQMEQRRAFLTRLDQETGRNEPEWKMIDRAAVSELLPNVELGREVVGASYGLRDGQVNSLRLLHALQAGIVHRGGELRGKTTVGLVRREGNGFRINFGSEQVSAAKVVIAAGLGSKDLARQVGLDIPIRPERGQMLITERLERFLPIPVMGVTQTSQGTTWIGTTNEDVGFDNSTTVSASASLGAMAIQLIPAMSEVKLVRQWAGLRIMTPDGYPVYAQSESHPGAFVAVCHSGVTLAAAHAGPLADSIFAGRLTSFFDPFHQRRFDVPKAA
jgi:glycine/D-amino acid oxidase-like deaminating enzyme